MNDNKGLKGVYGKDFQNIFIQSKLKPLPILQVINEIKTILIFRLTIHIRQERSNHQL